MMRFEIRLPNGDQAAGNTIESAALAVETLLEDANRYLRENLVVLKDGVVDPATTAMLQQKGMVA